MKLQNEEEKVRLQQLNFSVPDELYRDFKGVCVQEGLTMREVLLDYMHHFVTTIKQEKA